MKGTEVLVRFYLTPKLFYRRQLLRDSQYKGRGLVGPVQHRFQDLFLVGLRPASDRELRNLNFVVFDHRHFTAHHESVRLDLLYGSFEAFIRWNLDDVLRKEQKK